MPATREKMPQVNDRRKSILTAQINKRSFIIIGATTMVYTLAQLPYLYFCFELYEITNTLSGLTLVRFARFSFVIMQSSCFVNPIIYFLTNRGFRAFTLHCVYRAIGKKRVKMERRSSLPILSISRGESRFCSSVLVDSSRYRANTSPVRSTDRHSLTCERQTQLQHTKSNVIFNHRAYGNSAAARCDAAGTAKGSGYLCDDQELNGHHEIQSNGHKINGKTVNLQPYQEKADA